MLCSLHLARVPDSEDRSDPLGQLASGSLRGCEWKKAEAAGVRVCIWPPLGPWPPRRPYFECAVLGAQLLLELGDLAGRILTQLGEAGLESLHVLHQLGDLPLFGGQLNFQAGAGQHLYGLLLRRREGMTEVPWLRAGLVLICAGDRGQDAQVE